MPATILDAVIFPDELIAVALRGRKRWATEIGVNGGGFEERIFVRGDAAANYQAIMDVLSQLKGGGFTKVALVVLVVVEIEKAWRRSQPQRRTTPEPSDSALDEPAT